MEGVDPTDGGWITDTGEIHACDKMMGVHHSDIAERWFAPDDEESESDEDEDEYGYDDADDMLDDAADWITQALHAGWIRFGSIGTESFIDMGSPSPKAMKKLISILRDFDGFERYSIGNENGMKSYPDLRSLRAEVARLASHNYPSKFA
jgi:hypothetical protein